MYGSPMGYGLYAKGPRGPLACGEDHGSGRAPGRAMAILRPAAGAACTGGEATGLLPRAVCVGSQVVRRSKKHAAWCVWRLGACGR